MSEITGIYKNCKIFFFFFQHEKKNDYFHPKQKKFRGNLNEIKNNSVGGRDGDWSVAGNKRERESDMQAAR